VIRHSTGESRGYGFVRFATREEADAAIYALNARELTGGKRLRVRAAAGWRAPALAGARTARTSAVPSGAPIRRVS
jgi:RNA recognition motif-containing protein